MSCFIFWSGPIIFLWGELNARYDDSYLIQSWLRWQSRGLYKACTGIPHQRSIQGRSLLALCVFAPYNSDAFVHLHKSTGTPHIKRLSGAEFSVEKRRQSLSVVELLFWILTQQRAIHPLSSHECSIWGWTQCRGEETESLCCEAQTKKLFSQQRLNFLKS